MIKFIGILFTLIVTDFYLFPFEPIMLPGINVKMILAGLSLPYIAFLLASRKGALVGNDNPARIIFTFIPGSIIGSNGNK